MKGQLYSTTHTYRDQSQVLAMCRREIYIIFTLKETCSTEHDKKTVKLDISELRSKKASVTTYDWHSLYHGMPEQGF